MQAAGINTNILKVCVVLCSLTVICLKLWLNVWVFVLVTLNQMLP